MKREPISGYSIFEYWAGKKDSEGVLWIVDPGEKTCFKCGYLDSEIKKGETLKTFWNRKTRLEKAHIIPHALGGKEEPRNMIFLCSACHRESPDTIDYEANLKWISQNRKIRGFDVALSVLNSLTTEEIAKTVRFDPADIKRKLAERTGLHGFSLSDSSIELALTQIFKELAKTKQEESK